MDDADAVATWGWVPPLGPLLPVARHAAPPPVVVGRSPACWPTRRRRRRLLLPGRPACASCDCGDSGGGCKFMCGSPMFEKRARPYVLNDARCRAAASSACTLGRRRRMPHDDGRSSSIRFGRQGGWSFGFNKSEASVPPACRIASNPGRCAPPLRIPHGIGGASYRWWAGGGRGGVPPPAACSSRRPSEEVAGPRMIEMVAALPPALCVDKGGKLMSGPCSGRAGSTWTRRAWA